MITSPWRPDGVLEPSWAFTIEMASGIQFENIFFVVWRVGRWFGASGQIAFADTFAEPGTVGPTRGAVVRAIHGLAIFLGCCDLVHGSPGVTLYSAEPVEKDLSHLAFFDHRSQVGDALLAPALDDPQSSLPGGVTIAVLRGTLIAVDSCFDVAPQAIHPIHQCIVDISNCTFLGRPPAVASELLGEGQEPADLQPSIAVLHHYPLGGNAEPRGGSLLQVTRSAFVECLRGVEVRGGPTTYPTGEVITVVIDSNLFMGLPEQTAEQDVWGHLVAVEWKFLVDPSSTRDIQLYMFNNVSRAMSETLRVSGWVGTTLRVNNNTDIYTRFACFNFDNPNGSFGQAGWESKMCFLSNNLLQTGDFPAFAAAGPGSVFTDKSGVITQGSNPTLWDSPSGPFIVDANDFGNFASQNRIRELFAGSLWPTYGNSGTLGNYTESEILAAPPFAVAYGSYIPRANSAARNGSESQNVTPPASDFYQTLRIGVADVGAAEFNASNLPPPANVGVIGL